MHVLKSKVAWVYPSSALLHQILERLHRVCVRESLWDVFENVLTLLLAVDTEWKNTIFGQIHVCLFMVSLLHAGIKNHFEIFPLKQVLLELLAVNQRLVSVCRPGSWQHMQKSCCTFRVFVYKMRDDVLELLYLLDWEEAVSKTVCGSWAGLPLFGFKVRVYTH